MEVHELLSEEIFAMAVYRAAFGREYEAFYIQKTLEIIREMGEREQHALEYRFRAGMTYREIGREMGVSGSRVRQIICAALRELRKPANAERLDISRIVDKANRLTRIVEQKNEIIQELRDQLQTEILTPDQRLEMQGIRLAELPLSPRTSSALDRAGFVECDQLLRFQTQQELLRIRSLGQKSLMELIRGMRNAGYTAWASRIEASAASSADRAAILQAGNQ